VTYVERAATSDEFAAAFVAADAVTRREILATVTRAIEKAKASPPQPQPISPDRRVKVRWDDTTIERFKREAPWVKDNRVLARKLGLPEFCAGAMKMARSRYLGRRSATREVPQRGLGGQRAAALPMAA
jgi:hypothetical protein